MGSFTREEAISLMEKRGYGSVSEAGDASWIGFNKMRDGIHLSLRLHLEKATILDWSAGVLKMLIDLRINSVDARHARFQEFEDWLFYYAKVCGEVEVGVTEMGLIKEKVALLSRVTVNLDAIPDLEEEVKEEPKKATLEDRVAEFRKKVIDQAKEKEYSPAATKAFFAYWSEINDGGKKMRWEIAKTKGGVFNIAGRLRTWMEKETIYNSRFADRDQKKAEQQIADSKKVTKVKTKDLFN